MSVSFVIGQVISAVALVISVVIVQFKDVRKILAGEIASNLAVAVSFAFLGGASGAWICIVAAVQTLVIFLLKAKPEDKRRDTFFALLFAVIYVIGTAFVYKGWEDIVSCTCAILYVGAILQTDAKKYRWFMAFNSGLWIFYDIVTHAYVNVITHGMLLISLIIAMVRYADKKKA